MFKNQLQERNLLKQSYFKRTCQDKRQLAQTRSRITTNMEYLSMAQQNDAAGDICKRGAQLLLNKVYTQP